MSGRVFNGLTLILLVGCAGAGWLLHNLQQDPDFGLTAVAVEQVGDGEGADLPETPAVARSPSAMRPFVDKELMLQRPLFVEGRRPPEEPEPEAAQAQVAMQMPFDYVLEGLVSGRNQNTALLRARMGQVRHRMNEGEVLDGWQLIKVDPQQAEFGRDQQRLVLELEMPVETGASSVEWQRIEAPRRPTQPKAAPAPKPAPKPAPAPGPAPKPAPKPAPAPGPAPAPTASAKSPSAPTGGLTDAWRRFGDQADPSARDE